MFGTFVTFGLTLMVVFFVSFIAAVLSSPTRVGTDWKNDEALREVEKDLSKVSSRLLIVGHGTAIEIAENLFLIRSELGEEKSALSALSSAHYTVSGANYASARKVGVRKMFEMEWTDGVYAILRSLRHFVLAVWHLLKARQLSDKLENLVGIARMSPDELDIRAAILFRCYQRTHALECLTEALQRDGVSPGTQALLRLRMAEIFEVQGYKEGARSALNEAIALVVSTTDNQKKVRVFRTAGEYELRHGEIFRAKRYFEKALDLATENGFVDQANKIDVLLTEAKEKARRESMKAA